MTACTDQVNVKVYKKYIYLLSHRILDTVSYEVCTQKVTLVKKSSNTQYR